MIASGASFANIGIRAIALLMRVSSVSKPNAPLGINIRRGIAMYQTVKYGSAVWGLAVSNGWITLHVSDDGFAFMYKGPHYLTDDL